MARRYTVGGGPEWSKWCGDEGPLRSFLRWQRGERRDALAAQADREIDEYRHERQELDATAVTS